MSRAIYIVAVIVLFLSASLRAQDKGNVSIHSDPRLALLLSKSKSVEREPDVMPSEPKVKPGKKTAVPKLIAKKNTEDVMVASVSKEMPSTKGGGSGIADKVTKTKEERVAIKESTKETVRESVREPKRFTGNGGISIGRNFTGQLYRVQIYSGTDRAKAFRIKAEFMRNYPGVATYLVYNAPHYRVKVGNYRRREDATSMFKEANGTYSPCMIVPDEVAVKKQDK